MLELPNFGYMTTSTIWLESHDKILLVASWAEIMMSQPLFQNIFILRKPKVADFADIIKMATMFTKTTFKKNQKKNQKKTTTKKNRNYILKCKLYLYFLI